MNEHLSAPDCMRFVTFVFGTILGSRFLLWATEEEGFGRVVVRLFVCWCAAREAGYL